MNLATLPGVRGFREAFLRGAIVVFLSVIASDSLWAQATPPDVTDTDTSPYHRALLAYKTDHFQEALDDLSEFKDTYPAGDEAKILVLKSRILMELHRLRDAESVLRGLLSRSDALDVVVAYGDVLLREHHFDRAERAYSQAAKINPHDPDLILKLIYTRVGSNDFVSAGTYFSQLKPLDPDHPCYYFAKAALARSINNTQEAEEDIETARTIYGITVTNEYLKTYLEVLASDGKSPASEVTPPPLMTNATSAPAKPK